MLVCGAAPDRDIGAAREMVADGIAAIAPYAAERGVRLGIEPLHPAFAAERSCITTMREARLISERFDSANVGVVVDVYHVWWDPERAEEIARLGDRIAGYHVNDWLVPVKNVLMNRGMMGDGVIELRRIRGEIERAGYRGPIEVEIFNEEHLADAARRARAAHERAIRGGGVMGDQGMDRRRFLATAGAAAAVAALGGCARSVECGAVRESASSSRAAGSGRLPIGFSTLGYAEVDVDPDARLRGRARLRRGGAARDPRPDGSLEGAGVPARPSRADEARAGGSGTRRARISARRSTCTSRIRPSARRRWPRRAASSISRARWARRTCACSATSTRRGWSARRCSSTSARGCASWASTAGRATSA